MIKIDYEGAWKELRNKYAGELYLEKEMKKFKYKVFLESFMIDIEKSHTHDYYKFSMAYIDLDKVGFIRDDDGHIRDKPCEFTASEEMPYRQFKYYYNSVAKKVKYKGKNIIITKFKIEEATK